MRPILAEAVGLARRALLELQPTGVGEHLGVTGEDEYAATHHFAATLPGYGGWQWAVVVAAPPSADHATVSESALLPGPEALVPPDFLPWDQRVRPGDLAPGDLLATGPDDPRLVPGYMLTGDPVVDEAIEEIGLGRPRVLSREGREEAAGRWYSEYGPDTDMARAAPSTCGLCGFFVPVAGALRAAFGVCANAMGADGHVVHTEYGCGAHSDTELPTGQGSPLYEAFDDAAVDMVSAADLRRPAETPAPDAETVSTDSNGIDPESGPGAAASATGVSDPAGASESAAGTEAVDTSAVENTGTAASADGAGAGPAGSDPTSVAGAGAASDTNSDVVSADSLSDTASGAGAPDVRPAAEAASVGEVGISADAEAGSETGDTGITGASPVAVGTAPEAESDEIGAGAESATAQSVPGSDAGAEADTVSDAADDHDAVAEPGSVGAESERNGEPEQAEQSDAGRYNDAWAVSAVRVRPDESGVAGSN
ncbi:hypothetical protein NRB56_02880 [Nocardia sp. RB56]|uniref:DUF3027 domain-containing protein n=1 Tax=Nocardia aurantia TaxID=2585199 RepID=A0A7K0DG03_9NOCA|nr:hypothetical protein [Nocardia aurantia]